MGDGGSTSGQFLGANIEICSTDSWLADWKIALSKKLREETIFCAQWR
jgi:hypothetical protein